jgi:hypothetical protein
MRKIVLTALWLAATAATATTVQAQEVLVTPSFTVTITGCAEGEVSCDNVRYTGVSRKNGSRVRLTGKTLHTMGADGVTPARFLGWQFRNGRAVYTVTEGGLLEVNQGKKTLVSEQGEWQTR